MITLRYCLRYNTDVRAYWGSSIILVMVSDFVRTHYECPYRGIAYIITQTNAYKK